MYVGVRSNCLWTVGAIPRVWLDRWNSLFQVVVANWLATSLIDRAQWLAYGREIAEWESWRKPLETLAVPDRQRPVPQFYGATAFWAAAAGVSLPLVAPEIYQRPAGDSISLVTTPLPPSPPAPLSAHVWATWMAPGGWGGRPVVLGVFARSEVPLLQSNMYWRRHGWGGVLPIWPGVPLLIDDLLVACGTSGSSGDSWIRLVLLEPGCIPFYVGPQVRGQWFVDLASDGWGASAWGSGAWGH